MPRTEIDRWFWPSVIGLGAAFVFFEFTPTDLLVQDRLYDFAQRRWLVDGADPLLRAVFYTGPKYALIAVGVALLALALGPARWHARWRLAAPARRHLWVAFLSLAIVPALVGQLKAFTNIFCPSETRRYGGDVPYVRVVECYPPDDTPARRGQCFPAGHASGGFALLALSGLFADESARRRAIAAALTAGWAMGGYQMAKGAHYLSHTVITALVAWVGFLLLRRLLGVAEQPLGEPLAKAPAAIAEPAGEARG